jgi:hypothetical protein
MNRLETSKKRNIKIQSDVLAEVSSLWERSAREIQEIAVTQRKQIEKINEEAAKAIQRIKLEVKQNI